MILQKLICLHHGKHKVYTKSTEKHNQITIKHTTAAATRCMYSVISVESTVYGL